MKKKQRTLFGIALVVLMYIIFYRIGWLIPVERAVSGIVHKAMELGYVQQIGADKNSLNVGLFEPFDPELLEAVCAVEIGTRALLEEENEILRTQLNFFARNRYDHIGADVIGRTIDPLGTILTLNRGKSDGVYEGHPVMVGDGVFVGVVINTFDKSSFVRLINDNNSKVGATLLNKDRTIGLVEGGYGLGVRMNFIPQNELVSPGDIVVTSGLTDNIPRGLLIGTVEFVEKQPHEPFQQAVLNPLADLSYLTIVSVLQTTSTNDEE